ncbi:hypothetical protein SPBR_01300 [Sporothrix brasiliensis 5110]|uniref:BZIP domain-containing protein n=1 Tax=Sporothrix brasiliensis 5110 TaxID=1398154 RepID=A0A0C2IQB6_9PEZI|nr:uncharacterized protein SPBR_01300 [Sporothrix brasiliensis 5110]KIH91226.1 hypothetical protein SPBR_01300 [Sporothrix brasiliensis 5110]
MSAKGVLHEASRRTSTAYMGSNLDILNAVQYDIGVPLPAVTRASRAAKRKRPATTTDAEGTRDATDIAGAHSPRTMSHNSTVAELLSAVDGAPPSKGGRKPTNKPRASGKAPAKTTASPAEAILDSVESDEGDVDGEEADAEKKRARGRPRIDVKDVTAADRRRTQIRLAQRAYRSRKEKAIVSLEKRVNALKAANEAMSNAFMRLHDFALGRGLLDQHPDLAQHLRQTTEVFLEMARQSSADEDMDDPDEEEAHGLGNTGGTDNGSKPASDDAMRAFEKKQKEITDAVQMFGYQAQHEPVHKAGNAHARNPAQAEAPALLSQQMVLPSQASPIRATDSVSNQLYGGILMAQAMNLDTDSNVGSFDSQPDDVVFGSAFGTMNIVNATASTESLDGTVPVGSYYTATATASGNGSTSTGTGSNSNDMSSGTGSALSVSPASGRNTDFGLGNDFTFDGPALSLFANYATPPAAGAGGGQAQAQTAAAATSASDLGPHLASTDAFIASAAMGRPTAGLPLPMPYPGLQPPGKYPPDFSFGLRLRRYAIESAYRLISTADPPVDSFARAFGFCIMFEPIDTIRRRLQRGLETPYSPSKFTRWELPFVSRYPDVEDAAGALAAAAASPASRSSSGSSSSTNKVLPNNSNSDHRGTGVRPATPQIHVTLPGFEGAFYDCEETEMYLQQRGVHIPPDSNSVIVEVDDADFAVDTATMATRGRKTSGDDRTSASTAVGTSTDTSTSASASTSKSARNATSTASTSRGSSGGSNSSSIPSTQSGTALGMFNYLSPDLIKPKTRNGDATAVDWGGSSRSGVAGTIAAADAAAGRGNGSSSSMDEEQLFMSFMEAPLFRVPSPSPPPVNFPQRRLLSLNVDKFLRELVRRGTCLGQTPGFRASDVNEAFWSATRSASAV